jgi:predicted transport protein
LQFKEIDIKQLGKWNFLEFEDVGHYSSGKTEITIKEKSEIPYVLSLIKQVYERS